MRLFLVIAEQIAEHFAGKGDKNAEKPDNKEYKNNDSHDVKSLSFCKYNK